MTLQTFGEPDVLTMQDLPDPTPGNGELLIEVHASAMNPVDYKIRSGSFRGAVELPTILGYDFCGVIKQVGPRCKRFKVGQAVYGSPPLNRNGANAELAVINERVVAEKPDSLTHEQAAALPLALITAWEAVYDMARVERNWTVLIHAGAGGVGHLAIQLAKARRCNVIATASRPESIELCKKLGADDVIDYSSQDIEEQVMDLTAGMGCEAVFDFVGADTFKASIPLVRLRGHLVTIVGIPTDAELTPLFMKSASLHAEFMGAVALGGHLPQHQADILREGAALVDAGKLEPHICETYALDQLAQAHQAQESKHTTGKRVIKIKD
jgi:NADPH2:quinone reductase